jgi:endo-1,4-beta-xylanase
VSGEWGGGFQGEVTLTNTGTEPVTDWELTWSFPSGQRVSQMWNGTFTQSGAEVTVRPSGWNASLAPGASVSVGFIGSWSGSNDAPSGFALNGAACATG